MCHFAIDWKIDMGACDIFPLTPYLYFCGMCFTCKQYGTIYGCIYIAICICIYLVHISCIFHMLYIYILYSIFVLSIRISEYLYLYVYFSRSIYSIKRGGYKINDSWFLERVGGLVNCNLNLDALSHKIIIFKEKYLFMWRKCIQSSIQRIENPLLIYLLKVVIWIN